MINHHHAPTLRVMAGYVTLEQVIERQQAEIARLQTANANLQKLLEARKVVVTPAKTVKYVKIIDYGGTYEIEYRGKTYSLLGYDMSEGAYRHFQRLLAGMDCYSNQLAVDDFVDVYTTKAQGE